MHVKLNRKTAATLQQAPFVQRPTGADQPSLPPIPARPCDLGSNPTYLSAYVNCGSKPNSFYRAKEPPIENTVAELEATCAAGSVSLSAGRNTRLIPRRLLGDDSACS